MPAWSDYTLLTSVENGVGKATLSTRVTVEWVWQAHPNPVVITSPDNVEITMDGDDFQITADGWFQAYSVTGAPEWLTVDRDTGIMTIPARMDLGLYRYTLSAVQDYRPIDGYDYAFDISGIPEDELTQQIKAFYGHDPMPPDEQPFSLLINKVKPEILPDDHDFAFVAYTDDSFTVPLHATGDPTMFWSAAYSDPSSGLPDIYDPREIVSIDSATGVLEINIPADVFPGLYQFVIVASNEENKVFYGEDILFGGSDRKVFTLEIRRGAPLIAFEKLSYSIPQSLHYIGYQIPYTLSGMEPITVKIEAKDSSGNKVTDFTLDPAAKMVNVPGNIALGVYTVTATATNSKGESKATVTVDITNEKTPPMISFDNSEYNVKQGVVDRIPFRLIGSEPISVSIEARDMQGAYGSGFAVNTLERTLIVQGTCPAGIYTVTAKASNSYGEDSATITVVVALTRTPPVFVEESHNYEFSQITGMPRPTEILIRTTGSTPITYSLEPITIPGVGYFEAPDGISIDPGTGILTIERGLKEGVYYFTIRAQNDVGSADQPCSVTVSSPQMNPTPRPNSATLAMFVPESQNSVMTPLPVVSEQSQTENSFTVSAEPAGPSVSPGDIEPGLTVTYEVPDRSLIGRAEAHRDEIEAKRQWANLGEFYTGIPEPLNHITIRWDDCRDIYTNDRETVNGTAYITWSDRFSVLPYGEPYYNMLGVNNEQQAYNALHGKTGQNKYNRWNYSSSYKQNSLLIASINDYKDNYNDIYHKGYWPFGTPNPAERPPTPISEILHNMIMEDVTRLAAPGNIINGSGYGFGDDGFSFPGNPLTDGDPRGPGGWNIAPQGLDYGVTLDAMASQQGGLFEVTLDGNTGTVVTGKYFATGLKGNTGASISFIQDGATITFAGKDLGNDVSTAMLYDFGFYPDSLLEGDILSAAGLLTTGGESFTYSFSHHGSLPGAATFAITTGISEGSTVGVYRYDSGTDSFTQIADGLKVGAGGVVTYQNNTMSHYIITTEKITRITGYDAALAESESGGSWLYIIIVIAAAAAAGVLVFIFLRGRKKRTQNPE